MENHQIVLKPDNDDLIKPILHNTPREIFIFPNFKIKLYLAMNYSSAVFNFPSLTVFSFIDEDYACFVHEEECILLSIKNHFKNSSTSNHQTKINIFEQIFGENNPNAKIIPCLPEDEKISNHSYLKESTLHQIRESSEELVQYFESLLPKDSTSNHSEFNNDTEKLKPLLISEFLYLARKCLVTFCLARFYVPSSSFSDISFLQYPDTEFERIKTLDPYIRLALIGAGGNGTVSLVFNKLNGLLFAIKSLHSLKSYRREINFCMKYKHPFITKGYCYGIIRGSRIIVYHFMPNGSLLECNSTNNLSINPGNDLNPGNNADNLDNEDNFQSHLKYCFLDTTLNDTQKTKIMLQIISAVDYLHLNKVIHRDIKSGNVLLDQDFNAYLSDFDSARIVQQNMTIDTGTIGYMPPEVLISGKYSYQADIYSLGVFLYELTICEFPFQGLSLNRIIDKVEKGEMPSLPSIYKNNINKIYSTCISKNASDRSNVHYLLNQIFFDERYFPDTDLDLIMPLISQISQQRMDSLESERDDFSKMIEQAENGDIKSMKYLARSYEKGIAVPVDMEKSLYWYEKAAEQGDRVAQYEAGTLYLETQGIQTNIPKAIWWLSKADQNNINVLSLLGRIFSNESYDCYDIKKSLEYFEKAIQLGDERSMVDCALILMKRKENLDEEKAMKLLKRAEADHQRDFYNLGLAYEELGKYEDAFRVYSKGKNSHQCISQLAKMYEEGDVVSRDLKKSFELTKKAANLDPSQYYFNYGIVLEKGIGCEPNHELSINAMMKSIKYKHNEAMLYIIHYYKTKNSNHDQILEYLKVLSKSNYCPAQYELGLLYLQGYKNGSGKQILEKNREEAKILLNQAVAEGHCFSMYELGKIYEEEGNITKAIEMYQKSLYLPIDDAKERLNKILRENNLDINSFSVNTITHCKKSTLPNIDTSFQCFTCGVCGDYDICGWCVMNCHKGHDIIEFGSKYECTCDCGFRGSECCDCHPDSED
ncbi:hypothetical protein TRFO_14001 [Tritrichomonas foetus]|uniref:Protein kinase domain-containing protein n=1 Tax=Tritrichomonas foetus TaxID=1144522 RepID=A0A1J4KWH3_9EUKA|nr:hypothetical protein TRFO_14001 [Tritrichomonas foetus]|eukprot:OHT15633.1 hypothetical protein TRFO_14001 [Tritrichomonas foetus]